jgi:hypothetical protein
VASIGLALAATRGEAAPCRSSCTQELAACKRTCPGGGGQARRACRTACAERSTCTAPGARIRTLAYVVSECTTDPLGRSSLTQQLLIRRGNCDPVTVMEAAPLTPAADPVGGCRLWGNSRVGSASSFFGVFQRIAVLPDGSGAVFEVTKQFSLIPSLTPEPPEEGIFLVRTDGSGLRRLGPASRVALFYVDPSLPLDRRFFIDGIVFPISPNGQNMALIDLGPDMAGHEVPQIFLLDLRSGRRTQLTYQSQVPSEADPDRILYPTFPNSRTIAFLRGYPAYTTTRGFTVKTDGSGLEETPIPTLIPGGRLVSQFNVTGRHPLVILINFPDQLVDQRGLSGPVTELFLVDGKNLVQLTRFGRNDTGFGHSFIARGRVFFLASANLLDENPAEICQLFSVNTRGGDLHQLTHLRSDGRPYSGCGRPVDRACSIQTTSGPVPDRVTGTVLFGSSCDPVGRNPFGDQLFAMRPDGSGLRQLTSARGLTTDPDGTLRFEIVGPFAYSLGRP